MHCPVGQGLRTGRSDLPASYMAFCKQGGGVQRRISGPCQHQPGRGWMGMARRRWAPHIEAILRQRV